MDARGGLVGIITPPAPAAFATARRLRYHAGDMAEIDDLDSYDSVIDARTPGEYAEDHIPGAINLPALSDRERARIGALHKEDAFAARHEGARLMVGNLAAHLSERLADRPAGWRPLVYCARGGQRSGAMVEVMRRIGWRAAQLEGGYKRYRRWVMEGIDEWGGRLAWVVIGGKTGVGKTDLLAALERGGAQTVDLEGLANHRGSLFGDRGGQPSQRRFETLLFDRCRHFDPARPVFVESESRKIGVIHLPAALLNGMRSGRFIRIDTPLKERARYIAAAYQPYRDDAERFRGVMRRLLPHAGEKRIQHWQSLYEAQEWQALLSSLLTDFYDIGYERALATHYEKAEFLPVVSQNPNDVDSVTAAAERILGIVP